MLTRRVAASSVAGFCVLALAAVAWLFPRLDRSCACEADAGMEWVSPGGTALFVAQRFSPPAAFAVQHMLAALPASWVIVMVAAPLLRADVFGALGAPLCNGRLQLWEMAAESHDLSRVCPQRRAGPPGFWRELQRVSSPEPPPWRAAMQLRDPRHLRRPARPVGWWGGWWLANDAQTAPETLAAIPTERYLTFQPDGLLCGPTTSQQLRAYDAYDYVGAPWRGGAGGNGGFSLRSRSVMQRVVDRFPYRDRAAARENFPALAEDVYFSSHVADVGGRLPPLDVAATFSVETVFFPSPLAVHKPWLHLPPANLSALVSSCAVLAPMMRFEGVAV